MKFGKSTLFFVILAVALLATLGMNIKEGLTPNRFTGTRGKEKEMERQRSYQRNAQSDEGTYDKYWSERRGVRRVDIKDDDQDLYVLKSSIVPPVCPKRP